MAKTTKSVAKTTTKAVSQALDFSADIGGGIEGADRESYAIPFLRVIQKGSPQVTRNDPAYLEEAKEGMLFNTVTQRLYDGDEGVVVLPCAYQRRFIQWGPRKNGGGFIAELLPEDVAARRDSGEIVTGENGRLYLGEVNDEKSDRFVDTRSHYCIVMEPDGTLTQVILALSSTQIKKSKQLMSMLASVRLKTKAGMVTPPTWLNKVRLTTVFESNDQGSWYGVRFALDGQITDETTYDVAKNFHDTVLAGQVRVDHTGPTEGDDDRF